MLKRKPRILFYDIETLPYIAVIWGNGKQVVNPSQILQNRSVICVSWSWLGESKVHTVSIGDNVETFKKNPYNDTVVLKKFYEVLKSADIIVAHNGDNFDYKTLMARFAEERLPALPQVPSVDTLKVARNVFKFTSNKLDYLGKSLGVGRKISVGGLETWIRIINKDLSALVKMEKYNKQDVRLLKDVYLALRPYIKNHPHIGVITDSGVDCCPNCGSFSLIKNGTRMARSIKYQRYQCTNCGHYPSASRKLKVENSG